MDGSNASQDEKLKASLADLAAYTERGRLLVQRSIGLLDNVAERAAGELGSAISRLASGDIQDPQIRSHLASQLYAISRDISRLPRKMEEDMGQLPDETFTIALVGRTKVGKSTLVSILTGGNDGRVGDGSQRTTREAKGFPWEGLWVVDTPGVAAFGEGGEEDARKALSAASKSDLVIFVMLDDSLQKETASYLARVRALGKPALCLVNVKKGRKIHEGNEAEDIAVLCETIGDAFSDEDKLGEIRRAVLEYDREFSQKWGPMPFACANLISAQLSRKDEYAPWSDQLLEASRFEGAAELIRDEVSRRGCFMRLQTYVDAASGPLIESFEGLSRQSADSLALLRVLNEEMRKYEGWVSRFEGGCDQRAQRLATEVCDVLKSEADAFAERHFRDKNVGERWDAIVRRASSEERANRLLADLQAEATEGLRSFGRELSIELTSLRLKSGRHDVQPQGYVDKGLVWNRAMTGAEMALGIAALVTEAPLVVAAATVAGGAHVVGGLFLKGGRRERDAAIREFRRQLDEGISAHCRWLQTQVKDAVKRDIVEAQLNKFKSSMESLYGGVASLGTEQRSIAAQLGGRIADLNQELLGEALDYLGEGSRKQDVVRVARIPGDSVLVVAKKGRTLPPDVQEGVSRLLGHVETATADERGNVTLSSLLGAVEPGEATVEYSADGRVIAAGPEADGDRLRSIRMCMQLNDIIEIG